MPEKDTVEEIFTSPPKIGPRNVFPVDFPKSAPITYELFELAKKQIWDPEELSWHTLTDAKLNEEERLGIGYWFSILGIFDAAAPPVFATALIEMYKSHEEDGVRKCFATILRDELNHEEICRKSTMAMLPGNPYGPLMWEPKSHLEKAAYNNIQWAYYNGARYWDGYSSAFDKYPLPILFTSFLMGEVAATTLFFEMSKAATIPVYQEVFQRVSRDESRHARMALYLAKRTFPTLDEEQKLFITRQLRAGFVFLSLILFKPFKGHFWELPDHFQKYHNLLSDAAASGGIGIVSLAQREAAWKNAMLKVKKTVEEFGIEFPAMPEVGLKGHEVADEDLETIVPVF
jgi:rubrerythrin